MTPLTEQQLAELERLEAEAEKRKTHDGVWSQAECDFDFALRNHAKALIAEVREAKGREKELERITKADAIYSDRIGWNADGSPRWGVRNLDWEHKEYPTRHDCDSAIIAAVAAFSRRRMKNETP